jgi:hypothetical protein
LETQDVTREGMALARRLNCPLEPTIDAGIKASAAIVQLRTLVVRIVTVSDEISSLCRLREAPTKTGRRWWHAISRGRSRPHN